MRSIVYSTTCLDILMLLFVFKYLNGVIVTIWLFVIVQGRHLFLLPFFHTNLLKLEYIPKLYKKKKKINIILLFIFSHHSLFFGNVLLQ